MSTDYIVASLPSLQFDAPAPLSWDAFCARVGDDVIPPTWADFEAQLRNAMAIARGGEKNIRTTTGCSLYWQNRMTACFQEKDPLKREMLIDRVWWDAADTLTSVSNPLGAGALATYAIRLKIVLRRSAISHDKGHEAFDRLTSPTKREFKNG